MLYTRTHDQHTPDGQPVCVPPCAVLCRAMPRREDIYITHSGDTFDHDVLKSLSPKSRNLLARRQHPQQVRPHARMVWCQVFVSRLWWFEKVLLGMRLN